MPTKPLNIPAFLSSTPQPITGPVVWSERRYILRLFWSPLVGWGEDAGAWAIDLHDASNQAIAQAIPLVLTDDLFAAYRDDPRTPPGRVVVRRVTGTATDPRALDLGTAVVIDYVT